MNHPWDDLYDLQSGLNTLAGALRRWEDRDDTQPQPEVREAANLAMNTIGVMQRKLALMGDRLAAEIRARDEAAAARARELLDHARHDNDNDPGSPA